MTTDFFSEISKFYDNPRDARKVLNQAIRDYKIFIDAEFFKEEKAMYETRQKFRTKGTPGILENHIEDYFELRRKSQSPPGRQKGIKSILNRYRILED